MIGRTTRRKYLNKHADSVLNTTHQNFKELVHLILLSANIYRININSAFPLTWFNGWKNYTIRNSNYICKSCTINSIHQKHQNNKNSKKKKQNKQHIMLHTITLWRSIKLPKSHNKRKNTLFPVLVIPIVSCHFNNFGNDTILAGKQSYQYSHWISLFFSF